jgi:seryl-tRNA synthetase
MKRVLLATPHGYPGPADGERSGRGATAEPAATPGPDLLWFCPPQMLDRRFILENLEDVRRNIADRNVAVDLDGFVRLESRWRALVQEQEELNRRSNLLAAGKGKPSPEQIEEGRELKARKAAVDEELRQVEQDLEEAQSAIPNMTHPAAPVGLTDEANLELERGRAPLPSFPFAPKDHVELGTALGLFDLEAGSRVAGHGFYFLKGDGVLLDLALQQYALAKLVRAGFHPYATPDLARNSLCAATGFNPRGSETQIYSIAGTELGLIATSEITLAGLHTDTILAEDELPITVAGLSHCFRTEAGAHGRATRGLYRVHQFTKVEMFAFTRPEDSDAVHVRLLEMEKEIYDDLGIPYRVVENATGDLGAAAYRKFDIEAWMPGRGDAGAFGEVTSASNCTDYQARRLNVRYRDRSSGKVRFVHTLNGTAVATGRALIAILENYQQEDGTVRVPDALQPALGRPVLGGSG